MGYIWSFGVYFMSEKKQPEFASQLEKEKVVLEDYLTAVVSLSHFQIIYVNLKTTSTVLILPASKFEIWRQGQCFLKLPNLVFQVGLSIVSTVVSWPLEQRVFEAWVFVCHRILCRGRQQGLPLSRLPKPGLRAWSCACWVFTLHWFWVPQLSVYISSWNPHTSMRGYHPYLPDKETEAQNFQVTFLRSQALWSDRVTST